MFVTRYISLLIYFTAISLYRSAIRIGLTSPIVQRLEADAYSVSRLLYKQRNSGVSDDEAFLPFV